MITENERVNTVRVIEGKCLSTSYPYVIFPTQTDANERIATVKIAVSSLTLGKRWTSDDILVIDCNADMESTLSVNVEFYSGTKHVFSMWNSLPGGRRLNCCFELRYLDSSRAYPRNLPGHFKCMTNGKPCNIDDIDSVEIHVYNGRNFKQFTLHSVYITKTLPDLTVKGEPIVDRFGQWKEKDWQGKTHSRMELILNLRAQYKWAKSHNVYANPEYDMYGGWKKLHFKKKGYFYRHHDGRRWWLVDPLGNAFFSNGVCYGNRTGIYGIVDSMENLFEFLPDMNDPEYRYAWAYADKIPEYVKRNGIETAKTKRVYNFARANMIAVFHTLSWWDIWVDINRARLKTWGFNTISVCVNDYSDENTPEFLKRAAIPYCITVKDFPKTAVMLYRDFPDVFSDEYREKCQSFANQLAPYAGDPFFIGYFITNEPEWMFQIDTNPAERVFANPVMTASKQKCIEILKEKYSDVSALNKAWNTSFSDYSALCEPFSDGDKMSAEAANDFEIMRTALIKEYSAVPSACLRRVAPHALNMGMRYSSACDFTGNEEFDVFSFNCYTSKPSEQISKADEKLNIPFVIGEWHIGGSDSGLMSNALVNATTQQERGKACAEYMRQTFLSDNCVGAHYFELNDQPLLGRFDGENMQVGLIDVCNMPYTKCVEQFAAMNNQMYNILSGEKTVDEIPWDYHYRY